jgi:hypothetical protein
MKIAVIYDVIRQHSLLNWGNNYACKKGFYSTVNVIEDETVPMKILRDHKQNGATTFGKTTLGMLTRNIMVSFLDTQQNTSFLI